MIYVRCKDCYHTWSAQANQEDAMRCDQCGSLSGVIIADFSTSRPEMLYNPRLLLEDVKELVGSRYRKDGSMRNA